MGVVARQLWADSGLGPADVDAAVMYDHFTPTILMQLETLGFCSIRVEIATGMLSRTIAPFRRIRA